MATLPFFRIALFCPEKAVIFLFLRPFCSIFVLMSVNYLGQTPFLLISDNQIDKPRFASDFS
jgi:hypothetical protein